MQLLFDTDNYETMNNTIDLPSGADIFLKNIALSFIDLLLSGVHNCSLNSGTEAVAMRHINFYWR
jgi:hypothetical protein